MEKEYIIAILFNLSTENQLESDDYIKSIFKVVNDFLGRSVMVDFIKKNNNSGLSIISEDKNYHSINVSLNLESKGYYNDISISLIDRIKEVFNKVGEVEIIEIKGREK